MALKQVAPGQFINPYLHPEAYSPEELPAAQAELKEKTDLANGVVTQPKVPEVDPRYKQIQQKQIQIAKDFRSKIPELANSAYGLVERSERKTLADTIANQKADFNRRGLLYSGTRLGSEANESTRSAQNLATRRSEINQGLLSQADELDNQAINTGFQMAGLETQGAQAQSAIDNSVIDMALQRQQQQQQTLAGLGKAAGTVAGGFLGSGSKSPSIKPDAWKTQYSDNISPKVYG